MCFLCCKKRSFAINYWIEECSNIPYNLLNTVLMDTPIRLDRTRARRVRYILPAGTYSESRLKLLVVDVRLTIAGEAVCMLPALKNNIPDKYLYILQPC